MVLNDVPYNVPYFIGSCNPPHPAVRLTLRLSRGAPRVKGTAAVVFKRLLGLLIECSSLDLYAVAPIALLDAFMLFERGKFAHGR